MKKASLVFGMLLAGPLSAQSFEVGLFIGQQQYPSPHMDVSPGTTLQMNADNKTVVGARFGYSVVDFGPALLQLTAGFQPESKSTLKATLGGAPLGEGELKQSHWSAGAMFNFKALVAVGAGLEFRSESLKEAGGDSTTYNRVWARVNAGYAFPSPLVKPFIGIEAAFPLSTKSNDFATTADLLKSLAPKNQFGIYAGIRF